MFEYFNLVNFFLILAILVLVGLLAFNKIILFFLTFRSKKINKEKMDIINSKYANL